MIRWDRIPDLACNAAIACKALAVTHGLILASIVSAASLSVAFALTDERGREIGIDFHDGLSLTRKAKAEIVGSH